jgi:hypothetical protein
MSGVSRLIFDFWPKTLLYLKLLCWKTRCYAAISTYMAKIVVFFDEFAAMITPRLEGRLLACLFSEIRIRND